MRTTIDIDDELMQAAMEASGAPTKRALVEEALQLLVRTRRQAGVRSLRGRIPWKGDLSRSRLNRPGRGA